ncbi:HU family DNA-binding protein [bacterium]|nr:HU family DNA-binding protein [bacterium]
MTKKEVVETVAKQTKLPKAQVDKTLKALLDTVTKALKKGDKVGFVGFGTFKAVKRASRSGRNPQTGKSMTIKSATVPKFKPGKSLRDAVNK